MRLDGRWRAWPQRFSGFFLGVGLLLTLGLCSPLYAQENRELSLQPPLGGIPVQADTSQRLRVAVIDFFAPPLSSELRAGWLQWVEHELSYRQGFEGLFDVISRAELGDVLSKLDSAKTRHFSPLDIPAVKTTLNADWLLFIDLALNGREWTLRTRIYNGRSGAYFDSLSFPYLFGNLSLTAERLVLGLRAKLRLESKPFDPLKIVSSESSLLPESLFSLDAILTSCAAGHCLQNLATFETLAEHNPEFLRELLKNPLLLTASYKEADDPLRTARLNLLENNPHEASIKLRSELENKGKRKSGANDATLLYWLGRAYLAKEQPLDAKDIFARLVALDPRQRYARYALARNACRKGESQAALAQYVPLIATARTFEDAPSWVQGYVECLRAQKPAEGDKTLNEAMTLLADSYARIGDIRHADALRIELLDTRLERGALEAIDLAALEELERRNLASIIDRRTIQHDENEALILWKLAALRWLDGRSDEALTLLDASLKLDPKSRGALEQGTWESLERGKDAVLAQRYFERIPEAQRGPYLTSMIAEAAKRDEQALALWRETHWPPSMAFESLRHIALIEARNQNWPALRRTIPALEAIYRGAEDLLAIQAQTTALYAEEGIHQKLVMDWRLMAGVPLAPNPEHLFADDYTRLIKGLPLVGFSQKGEVSPFGKVAILSSDPLPQDKLSAQLLPYVKRSPERVAQELRTVLATRYNVVDVAGNEQLFRQKLVGQVYKPSKLELVTLASSLGVDTLIFVSSSEQADLAEETLRLGVQLTLYDAVNQNIFVAGSTRLLPFFDWYRFNRLLLLLPLFLLIVLAVFAWRFHRATTYWADPLKRAARLAKQHHYRKAAELLERHGYITDSLAMMGHFYVRQQNYVLALETFCRAHDFDNAILALKGCPENDATYTQAAELFFQMKDFERAEFYYRKLHNLPGMAKVAEARHDSPRAARLMGQYYFEAGNIQGAVTEYLKISDYNRAGMAFFYAADYREAAAQFKRANNEKMYQKCLLRLDPEITPDA